MASELLNYTEEKAVECVSILTKDICQYPIRLYSGFDVAILIVLLLIIIAISIGFTVYYKKKYRELKLRVTKDNDIGKGGEL